MQIPPGANSDMMSRRFLHLSTKIIGSIVNVIVTVYDSIMRP